MRRLTWTVLAALLWAAPASAEVQLSIANGRVTLVANNATVREIMTEWARVGQTKVVNAERVPGGPLTLELKDMPESQALAVILRAVGGYIAAPRASQEASVSKFDRILIMPTSAPVRPPTTAASAAPPAFAPPPAAPTFNVAPPAADNPEAARINELRNELLNRAQQTFQELNNANGTQPAAPNAPVFPTAPAQAMPQPQPAPAQQPATSAPSTGSRRPGVIAPTPSTTPPSDR
jgi:hypothetical protein